MGFRAEVRASLREMKDFIITIHEQKVFYEKELERLTAQNKDLMDRLMSRNFETLMTYQPREGEPLGRKEMTPEEDEQNAGEILDIEA